MILAKAREENKDFYEVLDYYLEMIRELHKKTYEYLGHKKASTNPLGFCQGGFLGGNLKPEDRIQPLLKAMTASFGITALNELQQLYNCCNSFKAVIPNEAVIALSKGCILSSGLRFPPRKPP